MKAWRVHEHGDLEVLKRLEIEPPQAGPSQVRVRVEAVGLNHMDVWVRKGVPGYKFPLPITPGCDIAGLIESFGPGAEEQAKKIGLKLGSPVLLSPGVSCGICQACLSGFDPLCPRYGILGEHQDGGCAELVVVPTANLIPRPAGFRATDAASLPIAFLTAWTMVVDKARVRPGETVLVQAGGSGVSAAAIQIAKMLGAQVITTVGAEEKIAKAKALGADHVINYKKAPFREQLRAILAAQGKKGVEVALDHVGVDTFGESMKSLAWGGRLVTCGATTGSQVKIDLKHVFFKNLSILGSTMGSKADLIRIVQLVAEGKLRPVIDSVLPMEEYPHACERVERREVFGKIVVRA